MSNFRRQWNNRGYGYTGSYSRKLLTSVLILSFIYSSTAIQSNSTEHHDEHEAFQHSQSNDTNSKVDQSHNRSNPAKNVIECDQSNGNCTLRLDSPRDIVEDMVAYTQKLFDKYENNSSVDANGLVYLMNDMGLIQQRLKEGHTHQDHHKNDDQLYHRHHHHDDDDGRRKREITTDKYNVHAEECVFVKQIVEKYSIEGQKFHLTFDNFFAILPKLLLDRTESTPCFTESYTDVATTKEKLIEEEVKMYQVWLMALGSVAVVSLLSIIGILTIPLMKYSLVYDRMMAGLIALAVGTLVGDAVLHLLPHAVSDGHHEDTDEEEGHHQHSHDKIYKHLIVVMGIYGFYLFETCMNIYRDSKQARRKKKASAALKVVMTGAEGELLKDNIEARRLAHHHQDNDAHEMTLVTNGSGNLLMKGESDDHNHHSVNGVADRQNSEDPHHGNHNNHHHHSHPSHEHLMKNGGAGSILDMAWMVIAGDGLHNFTDGLAIGAAFTSTIAAGLSTAFAIFFHELPHELGDFAVLIKAGMSVRQALVYNVLCACLAFIGAILGIVIGELTDDFKLWVLALTAGGFLYVALVDMLPGLIKDSADSRDRYKFIIIQIGLLVGIFAMLLIALYEENFENIFKNNSHIKDHDH